MGVGQSVDSWTIGEPPNPAKRQGSGQGANRAEGRAFNAHCVTKVDKTACTFRKGGAANEAAALGKL